jgi:hypothetical protein
MIVKRPWTGDRPSRVIANAIRHMARNDMNQQVIRLQSIDRRRFRKPLLYPLSYEGDGH